MDIRVRSCVLVSRHDRRSLRGAARGVGAVLYTLALWFRDRNLPVLYLACFLFGLTATSNVLLAVLLVPALIYALAVSLPLAQSGGRRAFGLCLTAAFLA